MTKKFWVISAVIVVSLNFGCAVKGPALGSADAPRFKYPPAVVASPAPLIEMVFVKGGCYQMGNLFPEHKEDFPEELPVHEVCVDDFNIGKYEVTLGQWKSVMGSVPPVWEATGQSEMSCKEDNCPVAQVSWNDIQDFLSRLNSKSGGSKYRLPAEAEWEYACRSGGKKEQYCGGDKVDDVAWYDTNGGGIPHPVGTKQPNGLGIYNMSGNVWEWSNDWYAANYYSKSPSSNPKGPDSGELHSLRGGCTSGGAENQRASRRGAFEPDFRNDHVGFRLVRTP